MNGQQRGHLVQQQLSDRWFPEVLNPATGPPLEGVKQGPGDADGMRHGSDVTA